MRELPWTPVVAYTAPAMRRLDTRDALAGVVALSALVLWMPGCSSSAESSGLGGPTKAAEESAPPMEPERLRVRVVADYPHDPGSYTQGLIWHDGTVFESSGGYGRSSVRSYELGQATPSSLIELEGRLFAEGLALVGDELHQLTWKDGQLFVYGIEPLEERDRRRYVGEGWGLAFDGSSVVSSDGTHVLRFRDPRDYRVLRRLEVLRRGLPQDRLNELEYVDGQLYANVYQTDEIVRIDPETGAVNAVIDASGLLTAEEARRAEVLNGIAYRPDTGTFLLTGKNWPKLFEVELVPAVP